MAFWRKYKCNSCAHEFEGLHYKRDEPAYECKLCEGETECLGENDGMCITVYNNDGLLHDGIKSPIDGTMFTSKKKWNDHLRQHNCREVGNDWNNKTPNREVRGDFDCRKELTQAVRQVLNN